MKNEFDEKWKFLLQVLVAKSVRRTSIITFQKISNFQEKKIHKRNDFTLKKEMDEARKKRTQIQKMLVRSFFGLLEILDMENSSMTKLNSRH